jgi:hypothetical protein
MSDIESNNNNNNNSQSLLNSLRNEQFDFLSSISSTSILLETTQTILAGNDTSQNDSTKKNGCTPLASFDDQMSSLERYFLESFHLDYKQRFEVKDKRTYVLDPPKNRQMSDGEARLKRFEEILESGFKWRRHRFQRGKIFFSFL